MHTLTSLPPHRRPREKLREQGVEQLTVEELLAVILGSGQRVQGITSLAAAVAQALRCGENSVDELARIPGIGPAKAGTIVAALHLVPALAANQVHPALLSPTILYQYCHDLLNRPQEHLVVFYLDSRLAILRREIVTVGTATASLIHPREVFRPAILVNAAHISLAHNHPSGNPTPSEADLQVTQQVAVAGRCVGIELVDHLICTRTGYCSLKMDSPHLFC